MVAAARMMVGSRRFDHRGKRNLLISGRAP
jgi:hypothetical protein